MVQRIIERGEIESLDHTALPRLHLPPAADTVFSQRAARLRELIDGKVAGIAQNPAIAGYLELIRQIMLVQAQLAKTLSAEQLAMPDQATLEQALDHMMPPLLAQQQRPPVWRKILSELLERLAQQPSAPAGSASHAALQNVLNSLRQMSDDELEAQADAILLQQHQNVNPATAPFIAAALQVLWTARAASLTQQQVPMLETFTLCPVCGSHPVASLIRIGGQSQGYRYLNCGICASQWHMVRVKCASCEANAKISYQGLDPIDAPPVPATPDNKANDPRKYARAETCDDCHCYTKIFNQEHDYNAEPFADDLASLTLDILVNEAGYTRGNINPMLWFGAE